MTRHTRLLEQAKAHGWNVGKWRQGFRAFLAEPSWAGEHWTEVEDWSDFEDAIERLGRVPDAWRIVIEDERGGHWQHPVAVLEFLEVEVTHPLTDGKLWDYVRFWWRADATEYFAFRVWRMDRSGHVTIALSDACAFAVMEDTRYFEKACEPHERAVA
jgi:hypothetical protein